MLDHIKIGNILFLDIETVPMSPDFDDMPENFKPLWGKKSSRLAKSDEDTPEALFERAGIYAEFGKIVCISVGFFSKEKFRVKSFYGHDERQLLSDFIEMLNSYYRNTIQLLCAHNGKEFDFPYISRRILINGLKLPPILDLAGKKPWEVAHLDTMELWKFGDYKSYTSLELLAAVFNIPTPKDDMDGSMVGSVYWKEKNLEKIANYCQKDVLTIARIFCRYKGLPVLPEEDVVYVK